MSEELQEETVEESVVEQVDVDPVETKARELGWKPEDEFEGDPEQWRSAEAFLDKQPLFEKIQQQNKQLTKAQQAIAELQKHNQRVEQAGYDRAIKELKAERRTARLEDDYDRLDEIDDEIDAIHTNKAAAITQQAPANTEPPPEFNAWVEKNNWYNTNENMRVTADKIGVKYAELGLPTVKVLEQVEREMKTLYPENFQSNTNPNRNMPSGVTGVGTTVKGQASPTNNLKSVEKSLTPDERTVMNKLVKTGALTKKQYLHDLQQIKGME